MSQRLWQEALLRGASEVAAYGTAVSVAADIPVADAILTPDLPPAG